MRNTAAFVLPDGSRPAGFYHKRALLLFGEYVPFWDLLPESIRKSLPNVGSLEAGTECPLFELPAAQGAGRYPFRCLICYEGILSPLVREAAAGARFLVNLTEDIWYGDTSHVGQHLAVLELRAVEERISIARAANAGPSGGIDPAGRMEKRTVPFRKENSSFPLRPVRLATLYDAGGYLFPWVCLLAAGAGLGLLRWPRTPPESSRKSFPD
jgi:apolipoprotein N-acyltransferase